MYTTFNMLGFLTTTPPPPPIKTACPQDGEIVVEVSKGPPKWHHQMNNLATEPTIE